LTKTAFHIIEISAKETYSVRQPVLRAGRPLADCAFINDDLESTLHFGLYKGDLLIGVATFLLQNNKLFPERIQYQLRGMAILEPYQGQKLGFLLLRHGEHILQQQKAQRIWCNAREKASQFYKKHDYTSIGEPFEIPDVGTHYVMSKPIAADTL